MTRKKARRAKQPRPPSLRDLFLADLARSGLTEQDAKQLKLRLLTSLAVAKLDERFRGRAAYRIPYLDPRGRDTGYFRLRFLTGPEEKKPLRYWQPSGSLPQLFLPPVKGLDLRAALADPQETLYVTEGEKKAYKGALEGLFTVGLGGVWSFKSKKSPTPSLALPDLDLVEWKDRRVVVVFDSDVSTKPNVQAAMRAFAKEVLARGARPFSIKLPPGPGGAKVGLDDFLVAEGRASFDTLEPEPLLGRLAEELARLNEELALVLETGWVWQFAHRRYLETAQFHNLYGNRLVMTATERGTKQESVAKEWLRWRQRRECPRVVFDPAETPGMTSTGDVNLWRGWAVTPVPGDVGPWDRLLDHLFEGHDAARAWFEDWCAYPLQHPGAKLYSAAVLYSLYQGVGKSLVGATLRQIYGDAYALLTPDELASPFNPWAAQKLFALGDEVTGSDKRRDADRFKSLVTREIVTVNVKYQPQYTLLDRLNYLFTTNHPDAFLLERSDRRFFVHEVRRPPRSRAFYDAYDAWLRGTGPAHLFHALLHRRLDGFNPREAPPATEAKHDMTTLSLSDLDGFAEQLRADPAAVLRLDGQPADARALVTLEELLAYADPSQARRTTRVALAKALRRAGLRALKQVRLTEGPVTLWPVRDAERWHAATPAQVRAEREKGAAKLTALEGGRKF